MDRRTATLSRPYRRDTVIALHCSGGSATQWRTLARRLGERYRLHTPAHSIAADVHRLCAHESFTLATEAATTLRLIERTDTPVHLVGHSYGGALALHVALRCADRVASVTLFEPGAFHVLPRLGAAGREAACEIGRLAESIERDIVAGQPARAMADFVDYWNGARAWEAMKPEHRRALIGWAPKAVHDFDALLVEPTPLRAYERLQVPVRLIQGECSPRPTHVVTAALDERLPSSERVVLPGVGHMGPLTHADLVAALTVERIEGRVAGASHRTGPAHRRSEPRLIAAA